MTYSDDSKAEALGIERSLLRHNEAVSQVVFRAMAEGALKHSRADIALAVTGFAAPPAPSMKKASSTSRSLGAAPLCIVKSTSARSAAGKSG